MKPSRIFHDGRRLALVATALALVGGLGCATVGLTSLATRKGAPIDGDVVMKDSIIAFGIPSPELSKAINRPAMAFIGQAHTYLLVKGGDELQSIAKTLSAEKLQVTEDSKSLYLKDGLTWGSLEVAYQDPAPDETAKLRDLGFKPSQANLYRKTIEVEGKVYPALSLQSGSPHLLVKPRTLAFRAPPKDGGHPDLGYLALLPAALAVDIVTAPILLIGAIILH